MIGSQRLAGDATHELVGRVETPPFVDALVEPGLQRQQVTPGDSVGQVGNVPPGLVEELHRVQVPERIRGEIADGAERPVDVLQDSLAVRRRDNPEVALHLVAPELGQFLDPDPVLQEVPLDLEAEHDVEVVG